MSQNPYRVPVGSFEDLEPTSDGKPGLALGLGLAGLVAWCLPIVGLPVTLTGLILGLKAFNGPKRGMATVAVLLCALGLALSVVNMAAGFYLASTGQHQLVNQRWGLNPPKAKPAR